MLSIIYNANIYYNDITINIITSNLKNEMQSLLITQLVNIILIHVTVAASSRDF